MALKPIGIEDNNTFPGRVGTALTALARAAATTELGAKVVPTGGATGYVLRKRSGTDHDLEWAAGGTGGGESPTLANIPAGSTITVAKSGSTWPARPTSRADVVVIWKGADPSPAIVSTGTAGMRDNVDIRFVTPAG